MLTNDYPVKVSIIVPVFNAQDYITDGLNCLLGQTNDERLTLYSNEFKGANSARKLGVSRSNGTFVMFMDADDKWQKESVEELVNIAINHSVDLVCCNMLQITNYEEKILFKMNNVGKFDISVTPSYIDEIPPTACSKMFKRSYLAEIDFINVPFFQDWNITYKYLMKCKSVYFYDKDLYHYIRRDGSTSSYHNQSYKRVIDAEHSILDVLLELKKTELSEHIKVQIYSVVIKFYLNLLGRTNHIELLDEKYKAYVTIKNNIKSLEFIYLLKSFFSSKQKIKSLLLLAFLINFRVYTIICTKIFK